MELIFNLYGIILYTIEVQINNILCFEQSTEKNNILKTACDFHKQMCERMN